MFLCVLPVLFPFPFSLSPFSSPSLGEQVSGHTSHVQAAREEGRAVAAQRPSQACTVPQLVCFPPSLTLSRIHTLFLTTGCLDAHRATCLSTLVLDTLVPHIKAYGQKAHVESDPERRVCSPPPPHITVQHSPLSHAPHTAPHRPWPPRSRSSSPCWSATSRARTSPTARRTAS